MKKFNTLDGLVVPLDRNNVDTDAIIPKQFLKSIKRSGFGPNLFDQWRYLDHGEPGMESINRPINTEFVLNFPRYRDASIMLAGENFGCGSSREHAPWALDDYGIRCIIAKSFADIFHQNCFKNGLLAITLPVDIIDNMFTDIQAKEGYRLEVDLPSQRLTFPDKTSVSFKVDAFRKQCLVDGSDEIALTLTHQGKIKEFEANHAKLHPWLFTI